MAFDKIKKKNNNNYNNTKVFQIIMNEIDMYNSYLFPRSIESTNTTKYYDLDNSLPGAYTQTTWHVAS